MDTFFRFLYEIVAQVVSGFATIINGLFQGIIQTFNVIRYGEIIGEYKNDFTIPEWILAFLSIVIIAAFLGLIFFFAIVLIKKYLKFRKPVIEQESLLKEINDLKHDVLTLSKEKDDILAMKVSQLGMVSSDDEMIDTGNEGTESTKYNGIRFEKLNQIDLEFANYRIKNYGNNFDLPGLCELFRNFAASNLKLYYKPKLVRTFIAGLASTKLVILQGISGTGKTSLAYAWGKFLKNDSCVAAVQPSWRERTDLFGYFNEFTKKFNETKILSEMYEAGYTDDIYTIILDEMNLSRVEYYFAEMLSILEMPNKDEWIIDIVPSSLPNDPKKLRNGKLKVPANMWYIGTINNDDSTFAVTDKVYDRAMPIDINDKGEPFETEYVDAMKINYTYLDRLFEEAMKENAMSKTNLQKIEKMDNYVISHFRIAFGNRIVAHMKKFVPIYVACGGTEIEGIDYFVAKKILRKFEQLNISYIRDEIDGYIKFLDDTFGKNKMKECIEYLTRLKKSA